MLQQAHWIHAGTDYGTVCPAFLKAFSVDTKNLMQAKLYITALGVYEAQLNGKRIGNFILAPGFTSYHKRHQYQCYDISDMLQENNTLTVTVGNGWFSGYLAWMKQNHFYGSEKALIACICLEYTDHTELICTDNSWNVGKSNILMSELYDGEDYDARIIPDFSSHAEIYDYPSEQLIPQEGEIVTEQETVLPVNIFQAPNGEQLIDFGQNLTGYVSFTVSAHEGDIVSFSHGEILDKDGNFFNENLRNAKQHITYICREGRQNYRPHHCFMGFRYLRIEQAPADISYQAIVVHSNLKRSGYFQCGNSKLNQLYRNIIWSNRGNFLDIPTDCPQRDERLGWTGDAQAFIQTACFNYDAETFFCKWLHELKADQLPNGSVPHVIPNILSDDDGSAAWGDAAVICPWTLYRMYGNRKILEEQFESMVNWVRFSENSDRYHFGDWLALDGSEEEIINRNAHDRESLMGHSNKALISDAFHLYSTRLLIECGNALEKDMKEWEDYYQTYLNEFRTRYEFHTQTECVLALHFHLTDHPEAVAAKLAQLIINNGKRLQTGFVGTPYLLHALSDNGYTELAYDLLLQEKYPSWLFSVNNGATTIWEHWDGVKEDGSFCTCGMNSYNHYAYGAVADWIYQTAAGIRPDPSAPGFKRVIIEPHPDKRLGSLSVTYLSRHGMICSRWKYQHDQIFYQITLPVDGCIKINGVSYEVKAGTHTYCTPV